MLKQLVAALAIAALTAAPVLAAEQEIDASDSGQVEFSLPSGNIGCVFTPEGGTDIYEPAGGGPELICERVEPHYATVILEAEGDPTLIEDPGEQGCCGATEILEYGNSVDLEPFTCSSDVSGLVCENEDGHGFTMARAGIELY